MSGTVCEALQGNTAGPHVSLISLYVKSILQYSILVWGGGGILLLPEELSRVGYNPHNITFLDVSPVTHETRKKPEQSLH